MLNPRLDAVYQAVHDDPFWNHLRKPGINLIEGYGQRDPDLCRVMLVGEAPGATENARGRPFCGPSGRVLNILMREAGLRLDDEPDRPLMAAAREAGEFNFPSLRANAFVTNVVKYRPPGNRTPSLYEIMHSKGEEQFLGYGAEGRWDPSKDEAECARLQAAGSLRAEWRALGGPKVIVAVGGVAHSALHPLGYAMGVTACAGNAYPARNAEGKTIDGYWVISQLHPAYGLRKGEATQKMMTRQWQEMGQFLREEGIL